MTSEEEIEEERNKFGVGAKVDKLEPLIKQVRNLAKNIVGNKQHDVLLKTDEEEYAGELRLVDGRKDLITFVSADLSILLSSDIKNFEVDITFYIHKPDIHDGITTLRRIYIPNNGMIYCNFFNGLLARNVDLVHSEKACCFLGENRFTRITDEEFIALFQEAKELYLRKEIIIDRHETLNWGNILPFANIAKSLLDKRRSKENERNAL